MNDQEINSLLERNKKNFSVNKAKSIFREIYSATKDIDMRIMYDFLGEILLERPEFLKPKKIGRLLEEYNKFTDKTRIPVKKHIQTEQYFLEKYILLEEEKILLPFWGIVSYKSIHHSTRVFITTYRIIILSGALKTSGIYVPALPFLNFSINLAAFVTRAIKRQLTKAELEKPLFGYQFPIFQLTDVNLQLSKKKKHKGQPIAVEITSISGKKSFELKISVNTLIYEHYDKKLKEINEVLQNLKEQQESSC